MLENSNRLQVSKEGSGSTKKTVRSDWAAGNPNRARDQMKGPLMPRSLENSTRASQVRTSKAFICSATEGSSSHLQRASAVLLQLMRF